MPLWNISGQYYETCSCDCVCPCLPGGMAVKPTRGWCTFAMAFQIERGAYDDVTLDDLGFIIVAHTPEEMVKGNWSVGLLADSGLQRSSVTRSQRLRAARRADPWPRFRDWSASSWA